MASRTCIICGSGFHARGGIGKTCNKKCGLVLRSQRFRDRYENDRDFRERTKEYNRVWRSSPSSLEARREYERRHRKRKNALRRARWRKDLQASRAAARAKYFKNRQKLCGQAKERMKKYRLAYQTLQQILNTEVGNAT